MTAQTKSHKSSVYYFWAIAFLLIPVALLGLSFAVDIKRIGRAILSIPFFCWPIASVLCFIAARRK